MDSMPYIDFLFGNEIEAAALAASEGWEGLSLEEVAKKVGEGEGCVPEPSDLREGGREGGRM